ncbi:LacI family DNA-binding transcriptional regulator [Pontiella agarivorans]|nr:LacI family DNA-binding transcriptional regulator [Pontiella agarivorans]
MITQKDIAEKLGLSKQAVSLALRGSLKVSEATRQRVKETAAAMGYQPDPALSALVNLRTGLGRVATRWNQFALLHNWPTERGVRQSDFYSQWLQSLHKAAAARGITIEEYWTGANGENHNAVFRKLRHRNITGIFIAPPPQIPDVQALEISNQNFQFVTFGPEHFYPNLHTIQFDFYENLRLAWSVLSERGFQRIGLVFANYQSERTGYAWRAAYHIEKMLSGCPVGTRMPLELESETSRASCDAYQKWVQENEIDAVISSVYDVEKWNQELATPAEVAIFNVNHPAQQGIDINLPQMAETAIELLLIEMQRSQLAHTKHPYRIHIPGKWVDRQS